MNIFVGNLEFKVDENELKNAFAAYGQVNSAKIIKDKFTGNSRGFAFIEMKADGEGKNAIENLNGSQLGGRAIVVNEARPQRNNGRKRVKGSGTPRRQSW